MGFCLVTVGTTEFRDLISEIKNQKFLNMLINNKIDKLVVQYGSGEVCVGVFGLGVGFDLEFVFNLSHLASRNRFYKWSRNRII